MFNYIHKIYEYLFNKKISKEKIDNKNKQKKEDYLGAITFKLNQDETIDISCYIPETKDYSLDEMSQTSESYGKLMMHINEGLLSNKIIDFIKDTIKNSEYEQDKLFFENVLVFWAMHHVEHTKNKKQKANKPLIMPSKVFDFNL